MSLGDVFESELAKLIFQGVAIAGIADNAATGTFTDLYLSLHTADPGEAGDQTTSEATYTGYERVAVPRTSGAWAESDGTVNLVAAVDFPAGTAGSGVITHFGIGTAASGAGKLLFSGTYTPNQATGEGIIPRLTTATQIAFN